MPLRGPQGVDESEKIWIAGLRTRPAWSFAKLAQNTPTPARRPFSNGKQGPQHSFSSSRKSWRFAHHASAAPDEKAGGPSLRMEHEDAQVLDLLQDSIDLDSSVLSGRHLCFQPVTSSHDHAAPFQTPRDDIRGPHPTEDVFDFGVSFREPPRTNPSNRAPYRSPPAKIRLLSSASERHEFFDSLYSLPG
jgi:hypothetical protein